MTTTTNNTTQQVAYQCCQCQTTKDSRRLPRNWKRWHDNVYCESCWRMSRKLRAVTIPISGPVDAEWPEFRVAMRESWGEMTAITNWMLSEFYARDVRREPGMAKLPPMPKVYLYPEARRCWPDVASQTIASLENSVKAKYRKSRYKLIWTGAVSLPVYRYPAPLICPGQGWTATYGADGVPLVSLRLANKRWTLRLRGGHGFRRQLSAFRQIVTGKALQGELALYRQRATRSDHRNGIVEHDSGGQHAMYNVMCKMVAWLPKELPQKEREGVLFVTRPDDALLSAVNAKNERLWTINADHVRRWIAENRRRNQRRSDDRKMETRHGRAMASSGVRAATKYRRRMRTACDEFAAQVVNYARRWQFAEVRFVGGPGAYAPDFPWYAMLDATHVRCSEVNILFSEVSNKEVSNNDDE